MKKLFYIILLTVISGLSITACTEENVEPSIDTASTGGGTTDPKGR
jgi:hypothetical protein